MIEYPCATAYPLSIDGRYGAARDPPARAGRKGHKMKTYNGVELDLSSAYSETPEPGRYYLILRSPEQGADTYYLKTEPGRTNQSHEPKVHGWLGTTNNVAYHSEGCVEVYRNRAGHLRMRPCADIKPEELLEQP
jgi:hypothetical protein